ncbi:hypothetical protein [Acinetobacter sp. ANC 4178]|uniref:hypothetical protein n=1 Tax=Acinetobacter sp. ANC 4178 TaxID=2529839 RepID=UPI00103FD910|nr:hypothetical protein [Acinetobacter sp. ANC 4178]TCB68683.1 hypothetical protein E0H87_01715 [Acinetobacter sp. ANC 4178]
MAANLNGTFDITAIALKLIEITNGTVFLSILIFIVVTGYVLSLLLKSGIITNFIKYSEHRRRQRNKQIAEQEKLLTDEFLKEYSNELEYHIKASKLSNYLNVKNKDLDLLTYILSCRNKERAVRLYKIGQDYLDKDEAAGIYRLQPKYTEKRVKIHFWVGTTLYGLINLFGASPFIYLNYFKFKYRHETFTIPDSLYISILIFFIAFFVVSLLVLWKSMRPTAAKNFLEMEKICKDKSETDALDEAA